MMNANIRDNGNAMWVLQSYVEFTSPVTVSSPTTVVTAGTVTFNGSTQAKVVMAAPYVALVGTLGDELDCNLYDNGSDIGQWYAARTPAAAISRQPIYHEVVLQGSLIPSGTAHVYSWQASQANGSPVITVGAGGASGIMPGYIAVYSRSSTTVP